MKIHRIFSILITLSFSCKTPVNSQTKGIIEGDDRTTVTSDNLMSLVGYILHSGSKICTAFSTGKDQITTANHCITEQASSYKFKLANGAEFPVVSIFSQFEKSDVITLKVAGLGERYLSVVDAPSDLKGSYTVGFDYSSGNLVWTKIGSIVKFKNAFVHTFDTLPGASGSPIFNSDNQVFGIQIGQLELTKWNVASPLNDSIKVNLGNFGEDILVEKCCGIKIPKKIGGTLGAAIGQVTDPLRDMLSAPLADAFSGMSDDIRKEFEDEAFRLAVAQGNPDRDQCTTAVAAGIGAFAAAKGATAGPWGAAAGAFLGAGGGVLLAKSACSKAYP